MSAMRCKSLLVALAVFALGGAGCEATYLRVVAIGDSHSDADPQPRIDWLWFAPVHWQVEDRATAGMKCWDVIPQVLADPHALHPNDHLVIFCGTNDAGNPAWDLAVTTGWIETAVLAGLGQGLDVTLVAPPPAFRDYPVHHFVRNLRLAALRAEIFDLAAEYDLEVADLWTETLQHPDPPSLMPDGLHFSGIGRFMAAQVIAAAVTDATP